MEQHRVGDARLQMALDKLTRVKKEFVDYRDLSPRHLGTIYEGLLEFHLSANETTIIDGTTGIDGIGGAASTSSTAGTKGTDHFTLALRNDKGERKATGSYYTPDYIVKYIVEETLRPLLDRAVEYKTEDTDCIEAVLGIRVLDPAMGSGHFLVEATETIARYLVDLGVAPQEVTAEKADLAYWKRRVVQSCIYGVDLNPLAVELAKLSLWLTTVAKDRPLSFLDHHLRPGNALVGARFDAMQSFSPLANGQRNIGKGDIGKADTKNRSSGKKMARREEEGQISMLADDAFRQSMSVAVGNMWLIETSEARDVKQVKQQEELYRQLHTDLIGKYGKLANLVTATYFGVTVDPKLWQPLADYATGRALTTLPELAAKLTAAETLASRHRFFHWELEFPEVYFDRHGRPLDANAGFDVVLGNPPYVRQEQLALFKPFLMANYAGFHGVADLYLFFYEQGLNMTRMGGRMGFISSGTFARANFAASFRQWLPTVAQIDTLIDFGENQPFEGAEMVRPSIVLLRKGVQQASFRSLFIAAKVPASLEEAVREQGIDCDSAALQQSEWTFQPADDTRLFEKIQRTGRKLVDVVDGKMYYGVKTGFNEAFIIDQQTHDLLIQKDASSAAILKPVLRGEDLRPWYQEDEGRYLIFTRRGIDIESFPAIKKYLTQHRESLEPRPVDWDMSHTWLGRKEGTYKWYEIQDSVEYYPAFEQPKIFWPDISKLPRFSLSEPGIYVGNTGYIIPNPELYLLGVLQSRAIWFAISQLCQPLRLRAGLWQYRVLPQFITRLPIPDAPEAERTKIGQLAQALTELARARYDLHRKTRHRLLSDLGVPDKALNQKLTAWYNLSFPTLRAELQKVFKRDIPLSERDDWEGYLAGRRAKHIAYTDEIIRLEIELNQHVYALFDLTPTEIETLEASVRYTYGTV